MNTLGKRIAHHRKAAGLSQAALASACGWKSQSRVGNYESGTREPTLADLEKIAAAVGVSVAQITYGEPPQRVAEPAVLGQADGGSKTAESGNVTPAQQPDRLYRYPVISQVAAGAWQEAIEAYEPWAYDTFELADYQAKGSAFWLKVSGDSMTSPVPPSIPEGHLILVDTGVEPRPGDMVVAKLVDADEATFKLLVADAGQLYLKPLNPAYRMIPIDERCHLIGVVVEAKMKLRR